MKESPPSMSNVTVIGTGYVGLTTGACLSSLSHKVCCYDIDATKIARLNSLEMPIVEAGLEQLVRSNVTSENLKFTNNLTEALKNAQFIFLCLPTPQGEDGSADVSYLIDAVNSIGGLLPSGVIVINKSTVPIGTTQLIQNLIDRSDVSVISNPEFLREGTAIFDFFNADRIVIGAVKREDAEKVADLYSQVDTQIIYTDTASAETIKYAANAFLATKLSFVNEIASICERVGADIDRVVDGMGSDRRIGPHFLKPGPGWGGSCFPKDTRALHRIAMDNGLPSLVLGAVIESNSEHIEATAMKILDNLKKEPSKTTVTVWGLTFKAGTDDLRDSPSLEIVRILLNKGCSVRVYDPTLKEASPLVPQHVEICRSPIEACENSDVITVLTEWDVFSEVKPSDVADVTNTRAVVDARNILDRQLWMNAGFTVHGIGK